MFRQFISQPVVHFILIAVLLFLLAGLKDGFRDEAHNELVIDKPMLIDFMQARKGMFDRSKAEQAFAVMSEESYQALLEDFIREEVLHREAVKLGMEENDYVIRRRLVQKLEYLARGFGAESNTLSDAELLSYFERHQDRYREPQRFTFTHVFVDRSKPEMESRALALLEKLNSDDVGFSGALGFGDRFIYHNHYVERDSEFIASHFDDSFARSLQQLSAKDLKAADGWIGPLSSRYGLHLVRLSSVTPGGVPEFDSIRNRVHRDALEDRINSGAEAFIEKIVSSYRVSKPTKDALMAESQSL